MKLGVNVDHVATLREARKIDIPDPVTAAEICEKAGCNSIVCHLREDRRHINDADLKKLRTLVSTKLNLEMACSDEIVKIAISVLPDQATLVPERREEVTTEGGLDVVGNQKLIEAVANKLSVAGIKVSLFIDPIESQIKATKEIGVKNIEIHTGQYANARSAIQTSEELNTLTSAAKLAHGLGLNVFAGHGLNYINTKKITQIKEIEELNIGHAIIARAVFVGLERAVKEMLELIK